MPLVGTIKLVLILNLFLVLMYFHMHLRHKSVYCMLSKVVPLHTTVEYETLLENSGAHADDIHCSTK